MYVIITSLELAEGMEYIGYSKKARASQNMQSSFMENEIYKYHNINIVHTVREGEPQCLPQGQG
jgi:fido (protein-threonine AMPylation protein)